MLTQLYIENLAVIERADISFHRGLNILTGETGAGKSILIDAVHAVLGERVSKDLVRTGTSELTVSAAFDEVSDEAVQAIQRLGFSLEEDGALLVQRTISAQGKSSCRINGRPATVSALKELGAHLMNIHGQNESYDLLSPNLHMGYIDSLGGLQPILQQYQFAYQKMCAIQQDLAALQIDEAEKARKVDLLTFQIDELESAQLKVGELEELNEQKSFFQHAERISVSLQEAQSALNGNEETAGALQAIQEAAMALSEAARYYPATQELGNRLQNLSYELEDCTQELRSLAQDTESDPQQLQEIEERLDLLYRLSRKYGSSVEEMLEFLQKTKAELERITLSEEREEELTKQFKAAKEQAKLLAEQLSNARKETGELFAQRVREELAFLNMPGVKLLVSQQKGKLNSLGCDEIQFFISTNPGEPPKPMAKIASGGELSRIMLSIKTVLADKDHIGSLIFDEVDTGVSGGAAQKVGLKLKEVSKSRQVICITHSAQIAALADCHLLICKEVEQGRTYTHVEPLDFEGRKRELARIIGGAQLTDLTLKSAEEMLHLSGIER